MDGVFHRFGPEMLAAVRRAEKTGVITLDEINAAIVRPLSSSEVEDLLEALQEIGVRVMEEPGEDG